MGYRKPVKRYRLQFEGAEYEGLEIVMAGLSVGEYQDLVDAWMPASGNAATAASAGTGTPFDAALKLTAAKIIEWNMEDDDGPVQPGYEALRSLDMDFVSAVITGWMAKMVAVPPPLPGSSNGSGTIPPGSIPMETLSPGLPS